MTYRSTGVALIAIALMAGCSSSGDGTAALDEATATPSGSESASESSGDLALDSAQNSASEATAGNDSVLDDVNTGIDQPNVNADPSEAINPVVVAEIQQPINVNHTYSDGEFLVSWGLSSDGLAATEFEIRLNGVLLENPELQLLAEGNRFGYTLLEAPFGRTVFEVRSVNAQRTSDSAVQWLFNDPGRTRRDSNLGIVGEPIERQFFEFPVRSISTINNDNYVSMALLMMNALQVSPFQRIEAFDVFLSGQPISAQTDLLTGMGVVGIGAGQTEVFLCENGGRFGVHEFRAGRVIREFDQIVYADCAVDGSIIDGRFEESVFTTDGSAAGVNFDERVALDVSALVVSENTVAGQFTLHPFVGESAALNVTIEDSFVMASDGLYTAGIMTAVASDGSTLTIDATTNDSRTVSYSLSNASRFRSGTLPWPKSDLPSPPANVGVEFANGAAAALIWPGASDDQRASLSFAVQRDGINLAVVTGDDRDFVSAQRTNFDAGYFRIPEPFSGQTLDSGLYSIVTIDADGNRSEPLEIFVE